MAPENLEILLKFLQIVVIGCFGGYIAYQQYQTNQQKLLPDLYDRRIKIYNYVMGLILIAAKGGNSSDIKAKFAQFDEHTHEADFLFTPEL